MLDVPALGLAQQHTFEMEGWESHVVAKIGDVNNEEYNRQNHW